VDADGPRESDSAAGCRHFYDKAMRGKGVLLSMNHRVPSSPESGVRAEVPPVRLRGSRAELGGALLLPFKRAVGLR